MFGGLATSGNYSKSIRDQPPHLIESSSELFFRDGLASIQFLALMVSTVGLRWRVKTTDDCFHDHNPVMIIMMIMMVVTMEKANMISGSDYINQDIVRDSVCDAR